MILHAAQPIRDIPKDKKADLPVSPDSLYRHMEWNFQKFIDTPVKESHKRVKWDFTLDNGELFSDPKHAPLMESAKDFIFSLIADPIEGRKAPKYITVINVFMHLRLLIQWMITNGYCAFSQLDAHVTSKFHIYQKNRKAKHGRGDEKGRLKKTTLNKILQVVTDIHLQRDKLTDAITVRPFKGQTANAAAGATRKDKEEAKTLRIPDRVSEELLRAAFDFTEEKAEQILSISDEIAALKAKMPGKSKTTYNTLVNRSIKAYGITLTQHHKMKKMLRTACYIVIAYFSGMRGSEVLSIKKDAIETRMGSNGKDYYLLHSFCHKIPTPHDTWLVPECVVSAVKALERLSEPLRTASGKDLLFLSREKGPIGQLSVHAINSSLNKFMTSDDLGLYEGKKWKLSTHQFRKSFAYFMAVVNKCNLKFLQYQFKHVSMDMTLWYALTSDEDLKNEVNGACEEVYYTEFEKVLDSGARLGGAGGERIEQLREEIYPGMTAKDRVEALKQYVVESDETYVRSAFYNLCFYNATHAKCDAGLNCQCNSLECDNAVITEEHRGNWEVYLTQNVRLLNLPLKRLQKAFTQKIVDERILPVFKRMGWEYESILNMKEAV